LTGCLAHYGHNPKSDRGELPSSGNSDNSLASDSFSEVYSSSIFPMLTRPALAENDVADTLIPLLDPEVDDDAVSWRYVPTPLSGDQKTILATRLDGLRLLLNHLQAENSERALHHVTMMQELMRSFGRFVNQPSSANGFFFNESQL
jgi:hypothetical protein